MTNKKRRIVVFGATGEIGGRIARGCVEAGHDVIGISRGQNKRPVTDLSGVEMVHGDRSDEAFLRDTVAGLDFDTIIDSVPNPEATARYARYFKKAQNVFLCSSTGTFVPLQYFPADEEHPWREQTGVNFWPTCQKDAHALDLWEKEKFPVTIFRPTNIIGFDRVPLELWGGRDIEFFRRLKAGEPVSIPDCEKVLLQSGSNSDLAAAFVAALDAPDAVRGEIFIISCKRAITLGRYLRVAMEALQSGSTIKVVSNEELMKEIPSITWKGGLDFLLEPMCFDIGKAERTFGYRPQKSTEDGLRDALQWCQASGLL
jgi:nucleoside-diphosphate-sugar epimerase